MNEYQGGIQPEVGCITLSSVVQTYKNNSIQTENWLRYDHKSLSVVSIGGS